MKKVDLIVFNDNELTLEVNLDKDNETVWLTQEQLTQLFDTSKQNINLHINNIFI